MCALIFIQTLGLVDFYASQIKLKTLKIAFDYILYKSSDFESYLKVLIFHG